MTSLDIEQITYRVREIIAYHSDAALESVGLSDTMDVHGFDSLDHVQITIFVEDELRIYVPDDMIDHTTTVAQIIEYAAKQLGAS